MLYTYAFFIFSSGWKSSYLSFLTFFSLLNYSAFVPPDWSYAAIKLPGSRLRSLTHMRAIFRPQILSSRVLVIVAETILYQPFYRRKPPSEFIEFVWRVWNLSPNRIIINLMAQAVTWQKFFFFSSLRYIFPLVCY